MSQLAHPDVASLVDVLDTVGQKYRVQRLLRGLVLLVTVASVASLAAGLIAHVAGAGKMALATLIGWIAVLSLATLWWVVGPLLLRPKLEWVARLVERRVDGLHNGLTNALLLAGRADVQSSPFTPLIYSEIRQRADESPIQQAVRMREILPMAWRCGAVTLGTLVVGLLMWNQVSHGWKQMFAPSAFVPQTASVELTSIRPGDTTLIRGQPLEVLVELSIPTVEGKSEPAPTVTLFVEPAIEGKSRLELPMVAPERFAARFEHVDESVRYRIEAGGTQSRWFEVKVINQIKLASLVLSVTPPTYTRQPAQRVEVNLASPQAVSAPMGSHVEMVAQIDTPVSGASLQLAEDAPLKLNRESEGKQYRGGFTLDRDVPLSILLVDGSGQIIARLPDPPVDLRAAPDAAPSITLKWPTQDLDVPTDAELTIKADLRDDIGLSGARVLMSASPDAPLEIVNHATLSSQASYELAYKLSLKPEQRVHNAVVRVQVEAIDNRSLGEGKGPQTTQSPVYALRFRDAKEIARDAQTNLDKLREELRAMLKTQQELHTVTVALNAFKNMTPVTNGQAGLQKRMLDFAESFKFSVADADVQKTLLMLARNPAQEAVDLARSLGVEPDAREQVKTHLALQSKQRVIIRTLESLLAMLVGSPELLDQKTVKGGDLPSQKESMEKLKAALEEYMKQQQKLLDQTAPLAKKPVDDFSDADRKKLEELAMSQEKLDQFMQEKIADFSKLAEQDMANASLLKELLEVYSEVTMAKDALKKKETEIAVAAEEMGVELAKEITSNLEKWLVDEPDRIKWDQEDPLTKMDVPMAELPNELEDMIGELMEEQEDLLEEAEDTNANWTDSLDKGAGWDAMDGPIANMSAKGVTGNTQPNNNEMGGRAGEGRSGKSQGEFVEETATGKGGRMTPTRLDPTPFQQGQIKDDSKDPVGGATGGGKLSGQGGAGLEGPVPPGLDKEMQRLAQKQAQLRNAAERLNLQYQLGKYDNFKLLQSIAIMRRVEADLQANRYQNVLRRKDVLLESMETSKMLVGGEIHVQHDTTPQLSTKMEDQIHDAMKGDLPPAWSDALKTYYEKLGRQ